MIDNRFRAWLSQYVDFLIRPLSLMKLTPNNVSWMAFFVSIGAAYLIYLGLFQLAVVVWWTSRLLDACDGIYARKFGLTSKFGAFLDIQLDMAAYSLVVLALFLKFHEFNVQWILMLFGYILCITGALSLGTFENSLDLPDRSNRGLRLAAGLAEGGETGIFYTLFLLLPQWLAITTWIWVGVLALTIVARFLLAYRELSFANSEGERGDLK